MMTDSAPSAALPKTLLASLALPALLLLTSCGESSQEQSPAEDQEAEQAETTELDETAPGEDPVEEEQAEEEQPEGTDSEGAGQAISMAEVESNDSPDSCWAVLDETVYDLTTWIEEHPGGEARIEQLCGTDATEDFGAQHGGDSAPESQLAELEIGELEG
ncbi:cytochrome b5 domain-containing protein [Nesterenkonia sandarakina]|uniref:Cytochrome b involved in lipid metabolism n=2 Tax=Nesterenkonia sandarakina TaxID=272918 RepID=A0A7Z0E6K6_9MICC|nr:cytochrome b involved in lipid metabolism [Nesterenkonia sandarakina]